MKNSNQDKNPNYKMETFPLVSSSFRDPSGILFFVNGQVYRQVNQSYKKDYEKLMDSGLYDLLIKKKLLIPHEEVNIEPVLNEKSYKIIKPQQIPFISYPYEWCFSELKEAALTTLEVQKISMDFGMTLKDANAYNIQFIDGHSTLIDTLSFETYRDGQFWNGYRQFCQHFLAPLSLMSHKDVRLLHLLRVFIDGIPLDLASSILPMRTKSMFSLMTHIHAHAKSQKHYESKTDIKIKERKLGQRSFLGIIESLSSAVKKLNWKPKGTEWAEYYSDTNYSESGFEQKKDVIVNFFEKIKPKVVWDLGANTGIFSRLSSSKDILTISFDIDPAAVEKNFLECKKNGEKNILPLVIDLTNPSSSIGWQNDERMSLMDRGPADTILALALIHHLAISNNVPLYKIAEFFGNLCKSLIIEFIPKTDSQVQRLLVSREDIFDEYTEENFKTEFKKIFNIDEIIPVKDSKRTIYLMEKRL